jgi:hypothetical protein
MTEEEFNFLRDENEWFRQQNERLKGNRHENPTLRDQFAMAALQALDLKGLFAKDIAEISYKVADAMLEARKENKLLTFFMSDTTLQMRMAFSGHSRRQSL